MNKIFKYIALFLQVIFLVSCSEDIISPDNELNYESEGTPVEFSFELPSQFETRGVENPKTSFTEGEVIHVEAFFYGPSEDESEEEVLLKRNYKALQLNSAGAWKQIGNTDLLWPPKATRGVFKAYFVKKFQQVFEALDIPSELRLSEIDSQTDPLYAEAEFEWGHKVTLKFSHMCTHLTFTNLDPDISDYFWLVNKSSEKVMNNILTFHLIKNESDEYELKVEFDSKGDASYTDLVYVQQPSRSLYDENNIKVGSEVGFFLEPGDYSNVEVRTINNYSYLGFQSEATSDLKANQPYVVDIIKNKGITFIEDEKPWDDEDDTVIENVDPETFLESITEGKDYEIEIDGEKKKILEATTSGTRLCCNVSFNYRSNYDKFELPTGRSFDGSNHFISEIATNIFSTNHGTIKHLGLKNINCENVVLSYVENGNDNSRWGILCEMNSGIISNIRIENADITFTIGDGHENSNYVFNVGSIAGSSTGTISEIVYTGEINIQSAPNQNEMQSTVNLGGFIGQSTGLFSDVSPTDSKSSIRILNTMQGSTAVFYVGGAIGQSTANVQDVTIRNVYIDSSEAKGLVGNIGGIIGRLRATAGNPSILSSSTVTGIIKGLVVSPQPSLNAYSYIGGIAGYDYNFNISDCRSVCNVEVENNVSMEGNVIYGVGGGFGRIIIDNVISDNYIQGNSLSGPENYIGNFAGIVPSGKTWQDYLSDGNVVRNIISDKYIGASIDDDIPTDD